METKELRDKANDLETNIERLINDFIKDVYYDCDIVVDISLESTKIHLSQGRSISVPKVKVTLTL